MSALTFDTLKLSRKLESAGFTHQQAVGAAEALSDAFETGVATKHDITRLEGLIRESEMRLTNRLTIRMGGMMVASVVAVTALVKLL